MKTILNLSITLFLLSCGSETKEENSKTEKKETEEISAPTNDKPTFETVKIGELEFASKNLDVKTYRNGDPIPQAKDTAEWEAYAKKKTGCWAYPDFNEASGGGLVYSGYCISDKRQLAPAGWKIPSRGDWEKAIESAGGEKTAGKKFKSENGWKTAGDNSTGFNAAPLPFMAGNFNHEIHAIYYWSSSSPGPEYHYHFDLSGENDEFTSWYDYDSWGLYIRCIRE